MNGQMTSPIGRCVSLYSFQEEYFLRKMTLEQLIAALERLDVPGVEIIPDQMIPGYPRLEDDFLKQWHGWLEKYGRTPVCMDMFLDWNKFKGRVMTKEEHIESVTKDIVNAHKLGCKVIRVIHDAEPEILERLLPAAEKYGVCLALEIHAPNYYDSPHEQQLIELFRKVESPYLGFTLDLGVFVRRLPRVILERFLRDGMKKEIVEYLAEAYEKRTLPRAKEGPNTELIDKIKELGGTEEDAYKAMVGAHMIYADPQVMLEYLPYTHHVHAKFYEMLPDYTEYSIPYEEIVPLLIKGGYQGYLSSEYEGNRWIQDAFEVDSLEQVRRHQVMLKRLLGEE